MSKKPQKKYCWIFYDFCFCGSSKDFLIILENKCFSLYNSQKIYDFYDTASQTGQKNLTIPSLSINHPLQSQITNKSVHKKAHAHTPTSLATKGIMESPQLHMV